MQLPRLAQRFATLDPRARRRTALALGLGAALVAFTLVMPVKEVETPGGDAPRPLALRPADPLAAEFVRCQALGEGGARSAPTWRACPGL